MEIERLIDIIRAQGEKGLSPYAMLYHELQEAKKLEAEGTIEKVTREDDNGKYLAYIIVK